MARATRRALLRQSVKEELSMFRATVHALNKGDGLEWSWL